MGVILLNTPSFFETTFKRWLCSKKSPYETFEEFAKKFPSGPVQEFFNEMMPKVQEVWLLFFNFVGFALIGLIFFLYL